MLYCLKNLNTLQLFFWVYLIGKKNHEQRLSENPEYAEKWCGDVI